MCANIFLGAICVALVVQVSAETFTVSRKKNSSKLINEDFDDYIPFTDRARLDPFDWRLLQLISAKGYRNVLISPVSLKLVLALLYEGSGGNTKNELQSVLNFPLDTKDLRKQYRSLLDILESDYRDYVIKIGTKIFLDNRLTPEQPYEAKAFTGYKTVIEATNFTNSHDASNKINSWVEMITEGHIKRLVNADDVEDATLLVTNALYFKGLWRQEFSRNRSFHGDFHISPSESVTVEYMMNNVSKYFYAHSAILHAQILRIPYKGSNFSMFIVLPDSKSGLSNLLNNLDLDVLKRNIHSVEERAVEVILPKFKFDFETRFSKILYDLGLRSMFQSVASFPGIVRSENGDTLKLVVSDIVQKAGVEINEEGSISYAATDVQLHNKFGDPDVIFNVSHPFLFFIEEQTNGTILFIGKVENPLEVDPVPLPSRFGDGSSDANKEVTTPATTQQPISSPPFHYTPPGQYDESYARFNYLDWELLRNLNTYDNVLISPASIKATLAMILEGAYGNTAKEIINVLRVPEDDNQRRYLLLQLISSLSDAGPNTILESSNAVFVSNKYQLIPDYKAKLEQHFRAILQTLNFANPGQAAAIINSIINNSTRGLIPEIVTPSHLDPETAVVLTNALYFKSLWKNQFDEDTTKVKCFYSERRGCINAYMMQMVATVNYAEINQINAHAIELPYGDNKHAMLILLPYRKNNFASFMKDVQHISFSNIVRKLEQTEILLELPRFEIEYSLDLIETLRRVEIRDAFNENANLSGIVYNKKVIINSILHKTKIVVSENGTEAAAATGVLVTPLMGTSMPRVIADHPFLFFIYKVKTGDILFEGILNEPKEARNVAVRRTDFSAISNRQSPVPTEYVSSILSQQPQQYPYRTNFK